MLSFQVTMGTRQRKNPSVVIKPKTKENSDYFLKFAILGEKQVGKTSLVSRYTYGTFSPTYIHTKGGDISEKVVQLRGKPLHLKIIDSAGHKYVRSLIKTLYRDVHGIMLVYDVTRKNTFEALDEWINQINVVNQADPFILLVGNKSDLAAYRQVPVEEALNYARRNGLFHMESSAKTGEFVIPAFDALLRETVAIKIPAPSQNIRLGDGADDDEKKVACCQG